MGAWSFQGALFLDAMPTIGNESDITVPSSLHMMQHVFRGRHHFDNIVKSIINTDTALTLNQHTVIECIEGINCHANFMINPKIGQNHHYRVSCPLDVNCKSLELEKKIVKDTGVWKHLEIVKINTDTALKNINLD